MIRQAPKTRGRKKLADAKDGFSERVKITQDQILGEIKETMAETGVNQTSLSIKTGTTRQNISYLIGGKRTPSLSTLVKIADALSCRWGMHLIPVEKRRERITPRAKLARILEVVTLYSEFGEMSREPGGSLPTEPDKRFEAKSRRIEGMATLASKIREIINDGEDKNDQD